MQYKIFHISMLYQHGNKVCSQSDIHSSIHLPFRTQILDNNIFILFVQNSCLNLWSTYNIVNKTQGSHHPKCCVL